MAETVGGISGLTRKYLPVPQATDIGKYIKVDASGNPVYEAETPGGIVDEAGANAANSIGDAVGADTTTKLATFLPGEIEAGTAIETPNDTDVMPGVKADHSMLKYTWTNIKAAIATFLDRASTTIKGIVLLGAYGGAPKIIGTPDGATNDYVSNFATTDGWSAVGTTGSIAVSDGSLIFTHTNNIYAKKTLATTTGKYIAIEFKVTGSPSENYLRILWSIAGTYTRIPFVIGEKTFAIIPSQIAASYIGFACGTYSDSAEYVVTVYSMTYGDLGVVEGSVIRDGVSLLNALSKSSNRASLVGSVKRSEYPDGAGCTYQSSFKNHNDGWYISGAGSLTADAVENSLAFAHTGTGFFKRDFTTELGKFIAISFVVTGSPPSNSLTVSTGGTPQYYPFVLGQKTLVIVPVFAGSTVSLFCGSSYSTADNYTLKLYGVSYGDMSFAEGSLTAQAAQWANQQTYQAGQPNPIRLPDKIYAVVGRECNIYFNNLVGFDPVNYFFDVTCAVGIHQSERWTYTPSVAGSNAITIAMHDRRTGEKIWEKASTVVAVAAAAGSGTPKVLAIGDSTTAGSQIVGELKTLMDADGAMDVELVGTKGTAPVLHEGISGWKVDDFSKTGSPFYIDGAVNFSRYISDNSLAGCDIAVIHLGINDIFAQTTDAGADTIAATAKTQLDTLIASIKTYNASAKIGLAVTIPPAATQDAFGDDYNSNQVRLRYLRNLARWQKMLIDNYGGRTAESIYLVPYNTALDPVHNFPKAAAAPWNSRTSETTERQSNGVHPADIGYYQLADVLYAWIKAIS